MDLALFDRIRRIVKIVIGGIAAAVVVMVFVAVMANALRSSLNEDNRSFHETASAAALQAPAPRVSPVAHPVEATTPPTGDQLRAAIASAATSLIRGIGLDADASAAGNTLMIAASSGCDRKALVDIRDSLVKMDLKLSEAFAAIRCFGGVELQLR